MIVVDAPVVVAALLANGAAGESARAALTADPDVHAPHLLDIEVASAIRRWVLAERLTPQLAALALADLRDLAVTRHGHDLLLDRILELRAPTSAYAGAYVALAELLGARLVTADARLARAAVLRCPVDVLTA
ncbi:MAG TPA: type II toxin-antitoxin system VapC family toxin [Blastococcus sp.]|nr:type II toxin-antitoxin system VapC family toxin [Blastococcus sp.]